MELLGQPKLLHLYAIGFPDPNHLQKQEMMKAIRRIVDKHGYDKNHTRFLVNGEDGGMINLLEELKKTYYPDVDITVFTPDFKKHNKKAYPKRNQKALLRCSHVVMFSNGELTYGQKYLKKAVDESGKFLWLKTIEVGGQDEQKE